MKNTPISGKAEPMFTMKTSHDLDLDKVSWYIRSHDSSYGGYPYKMEATIGIPADLLKSMIKTKDDPKAMIAQQLYFYFNGHGIKLSNPSFGSIGRAKGNVKPISVTYYMKSPFEAYALGADLGFGKGGKLNIDNYKARLKSAQTYYDKALKLKENARTEIAKKVAEGGYKDAESKENASKDLWEQGYKKDWIKLMDEMDGKGLSFVSLHHDGKN